MRLAVQSSEGTHLRLPIPAGVACSRLSACILARSLSRYMPQGLKAKELYKLLRSVKRTCRQYKGLVIVEVISHDGDEVRLTL